MITWSIFYKRHGLTTLSRLSTPIMSSLNDLVLPVNVAYHFTELDTDHVSVESDDLIMRLNKANVVINHISDLPANAMLGRPRVHSLQVNQLVNEYHHHHKQYHLLKNSLTVARNPKTLLVESYSLLARHYIYPTNYLMGFNRWHNLYTTVIDKIAEMTKTSDRQHLLVLHMPDLLPSITQLNQSANRTVKSVIKRFNTDGLRLIADVWHWLGPDRGLPFDKRTVPMPVHEEHSEEEKEALLESGITDEVHVDLLGGLTDAQLKQVNLLVIHGGMWTVINLGVLNSFRKKSPTDKALPGQPPKMDPDKLQRRFLHMLSTINATSSATVQKNEPEETDTVSKSDDNASDVPVKIADYDLSVPPQNMQKDEAKLAATEQKANLVDIIRKANVFDADTPDDNGNGKDEPPEISDEDIEKDLKQLEAINNEVEKVEEETTYHPYQPRYDSLENGVKHHTEDAAKAGLLSPAEFRAMNKLAEKYKTIPNPITGKGTIAEMIVITPEEIEVKETNPLAEKILGVTDKSMLSNSLQKFDETYIREIMPRHVVRTVMQLQQAGIAIHSYDVNRVETFTDSFETHTIKLVPVTGKSSTIKFTMPVVNENATFKANGVNYIARKQKGEIPIRKTAPDVVVLTSYYSKMFVQRSERAANNYNSWLGNQLIAMYTDENNTRIKDLKSNDVFYPHETLPRPYTALAMRVSQFRIGKYHFCFDYHKRFEILGSASVSEFEEGDLIVIAVADDGKSAFLMNSKTGLCQHRPVPEKGDVAFPIETILEIDIEKRPTDMAEVDVFGQTIPLGFLLAYHTGLGNLIATLKPKLRRVKTGSNYNLTPHEYIVKFSDEALIFERDGGMNDMIFSGFNRYHRDIKNYSVFSFDKRAGFGSVLEDNSIASRYLREYDLMFKMWVDHITLDLLKQFNQPTNLFDIFVYAVKMLVNDKHSLPTDGSETRIKGYERFSGMLYTELMRALRDYNSKPMNANAQVSMNPEAVWMSILKDQTVSPVEESNPIHQLKETETVIFSGQGGRSGRSMTAESRRFHENDTGVISEATVDSGDVATIVSLTADPNFDSLYGTTRRTKPSKDNPARCVSTSMMLGPGLDRDDPKRTNFASVQNSQMTHCVGYVTQPTRTGYERVLIHRVNENFGKTARLDGKVVNRSEDVITIEYKDKTQVSYRIGRVFGNRSGHVVPHQLDCDLKTGQSFKKGDVLFYNSNYFERDVLDPEQVIYKGSVLARTVLWESADTLEDSSAITEELGKRLSTTVTHIRNIKVSFSQEVRNLMKVGEVVDYETILCTIHNATEGNAEVYDEEALETLSALSQSTPRAKTVGTIEKIEVLYTGDPDEMTNSLRKLTLASDDTIRRINRQMGKRAADGLVEVGYRIDGHPLEADAAVIRVYITGVDGMRGGDKLVYANQMKSIVGRIITDELTSEDGEPIDAIFGYQSLVNRIVLSAELTGTTNTLLLALGERMVRAYESDEK